MLARIGPTQGVQASPKQSPSITGLADDEDIKLKFLFKAWNL